MGNRHRFITTLTFQRVALHVGVLLLISTAAFVGGFYLRGLIIQHSDLQLPDLSIGREGPLFLDTLASQADSPSTKGVVTLGTRQFSHALSYEMDGNLGYRTTYQLSGHYASFETMVGQIGHECFNPVTLSVLADNARLFMQRLSENAAPARVAVDLTAGGSRPKSLTIQTDSGNLCSTTVVWGNPQLFP
jgi:hypothetical protein